jgi:pyrroline-5-carboxylate reductase
MNFNKIKLGFIGGGIMAENILKGILQAGLMNKAQITVSDLNASRLILLKKQFNIKTEKDNKKIVSQCDIIVLAVKPQNMKELLEGVSENSNNKKLFISIAAGIKSAAISRDLSGKGRIVRVMPNVAAKVLESASAVCKGPQAKNDDIKAALNIFDAIGKTVIVKEDLMDAVTGLSGSGPAYVFLFIDAMADAGVKAGLPRATALKLAVQTFFGASKLLIETGETPAAAKDQVTSPGGTTICGLHSLEKGSVRADIINAVEAAILRSKELGR